MIEWLFVPIAYLIGSISSAIIICRLMGLPDPRGQGSGNPGATNVMRIGGKKAAAITLLGDLLKGLLPVYGANYLGVSAELLASIGLPAFMGHLYPAPLLSLQAAKAWRPPSVSCWAFPGCWVGLLL